MKHQSETRQNDHAPRGFEASEQVRHRERICVSLRRHPERSNRRRTRADARQIDANLAEAGTDKSKVVNVNIWLKDISTFAEMNEAWLEWADPEALPARATVEAKLARDDILVEIMVCAAL